MLFHSSRLACFRFLSKCNYQAVYAWARQTGSVRFPLFCDTAMEGMDIGIRVTKCTVSCMGRENRLYNFCQFVV